ncbi:MAG: hypothetical protein MUE98_05395 [Rhodobacteraceae bacterium]|jgi:hypothetical protein|nr:hypothetical protein [Paracoccaceae bacterium]
MEILFNIAVGWFAVLFLLYVVLLAFGLNLLPNVRSARVIAGAAFTVMLVGGATPF